MKFPIYKVLLLIMSIISIAILVACTDSEVTTKDNEQKAKSTEQVEKKLKNNIKLSAERCFIRDKVEFEVTDLKPNEEAELTWNSIDGKYIVEDLYTVVGPEFTEKEITLIKGKADDKGQWSGTFEVPEGFGGDFTIWVKQNNGKIGQVGYTVAPSFVMEPTSGPVGTEITIKMEGLGWSAYMRNWQLTYDNKYTGLVTAISTKGTAEAKIRAAGEIGKHAIRLRTGYLGMQYINYLQSPYPDKPTPDFLFEVTEGIADSIANHV